MCSIREFILQKQIYYCSDGRPSFLYWKWSIFETIFFGDQLCHCAGIKIIKWLTYLVARQHWHYWLQLWTISSLYPLYAFRGLYWSNLMFQNKVVRTTFRPKTPGGKSVYTCSKWPAMNVGQKTCHHSLHVAVSYWTELNCLRDTNLTRMWRMTSLR